MLCTRCGRKTHNASSCYATKHVKGYIISKKDEEKEQEEEYSSDSSSDDDEYIVADSRGCYHGFYGEFEDNFEEEEIEESRGVYCLKLNNGKYYIGKSEDVDSRIGNHEKGRGSAWTKLHGVIKEIPTITPHMDDLESWERCETIEMALKYGIENVRGHLWTRITLPHTEIVSFETQACERMDLCRKCGREGHMIGSCRARGRASWMTPPPIEKKSKIEVSKKYPLKRKKKIEDVKDEPVKKKWNGWRKQRVN